MLSNIEMLEMIIIIRCWTVEFIIDDFEDGDGTIQITTKVGTMIAMRVINYETINHAIKDSFGRVKHIVMAVCGDIEREHTYDH